MYVVFCLFVFNKYFFHFLWLVKCYHVFSDLFPVVDTLLVVAVHMLTNV